MDEPSSRPEGRAGVAVAPRPLRPVLTTADDHHTTDARWPAPDGGAVATIERDRDADTRDTDAHDADDGHDQIAPQLRELPRSSQRASWSPPRRRDVPGPDTGPVLTDDLRRLDWPTPYEDMADGERADHGGADHDDTNGRSERDGDAHVEHDEHDEHDDAHESDGDGAEHDPHDVAAWPPPAAATEAAAATWPAPVELDRVTLWPPRLPQLVRHGSNDRADHRPFLPRHPGPTARPHGEPLPPPHPALFPFPVDVTPPGWVAQPPDRPIATTLADDTVTGPAAEPLPLRRTRRHNPAWGWAAAGLVGLAAGVVIAPDRSDRPRLVPADEAVGPGIDPGIVPGGAATDTTVPVIPPIPDPSADDPVAQLPPAGPAPSVAPVPTDAPAAPDEPGAPDATGGPAPTGEPVPPPVISIETSFAGTGNEEWVRLMNAGTADVDLSGWQILDDGFMHLHVFDALVLAPGQSVTLYGGCGDPTPTTRYWCSPDEVWNDAGDVATLVDRDGNVVASSAL